MLEKRASRRVLETIVVVGLDPGLANLGLGAVSEKGRAVTHLGHQLVRTNARTHQSERLACIYQETKTFLSTHQPQALSIEGQYFHRQREVSFKVGQAVGVCLLAAYELDIPVFEYGPMQVKQALVGTGRASKAQVGFMVRSMLSLSQTPESHHVADALALALAHLSYRRIGALG